MLNLLVNRQGRKKRGKQASDSFEACSLSSANGDVSKDPVSAAGALDREQTQAEPLPPRDQLRGAVHLKACNRRSSGGGQADDVDRVRLDFEMVCPAMLTRIEQSDV